MSYKKTYCKYRGKAFLLSPWGPAPQFKVNYFHPPPQIHSYFRFKSLSPHISSSFVFISTHLIYIRSKHFTYYYSPHPLLSPPPSHLYPPLPPSLTSSIYYVIMSCHIVMSLCLCHIVIHICHIVTCHYVMTISH